LPFHANILRKTDRKIHRVGVAPMAKTIGGRRIRNPLTKFYGAGTKTQGAGIQGIIEHKNLKCSLDWSGWGTSNRGFDQKMGSVPACRKSRRIQPKRKSYDTRKDQESTLR